MINGQRGFTLIELSIVLVIIGLVIGGVVVGQDLIRAASVRATVSQLEKYQTAVNTFKGKYGYLPGDMSNELQFGFAVRGDDNPGVGRTADGDGNGMIEGCWYPGSQMYGCETALFWRDLGDAQLIEGNYDSVTDGGGNPIQVLIPSQIPNYLPPAKLGGGNYFAVFTGGLSGFDGSVAGVKGNNYFMLGYVGWTSDDYGIDHGGMTPNDALSIDKKIDDGMPASGTVMTLTYPMPDHNFSQPDVPTPGHNDTACALNNNATYAAGTGAAANAMTCDLMIRFN